MSHDNKICEKVVRFADTDASGVAHFSRLLCLVEEVEHDLVESVGVSVLGVDIGWPRVRVAIDFHSPACFGDRLSIWLVVGKIGTSSLTWNVSVTCGDRLVLDGYYVTVRVGGDGEKCPIPERERLSLALLGE